MYFYFLIKIQMLFFCIYLYRIVKAFVWRQLEQRIFCALTSVGALFIFIKFQEEIMKNRKLFLLIALASLVISVVFFSACEKSEQTPLKEPYTKIAYCNRIDEIINLGQEWDSDLTIIKEVSKSQAKYKAIKYYDGNDVLVKCEVMDKETNEPELTIEYNENGEIATCKYSDRPSTTYIYEYNSNGMISKILIKHIKYEEAFVCVGFEYNSDGHRIKRTEYNALPGTISREIKYEYDGAGRLSKATEIFYGYEGNTEPESSVYYTYEYDNSGNMIKESYYNSARERTNHYNIYEYESSVLRQETRYVKSTFEGTEEYISTACIKYDSNGNVIEAVGVYRENFSATTFNYTTYEYDDRGNLIKELYYDPWSVELTVLMEWRFEYDSNDNKTKETFIVRENEVMCAEYQYDENGNYTKSVIYDADKNVLEEENGYIDAIVCYTSHNNISINFYAYECDRVTFYNVDENGKLVKEEK